MDVFIAMFRPAGFWINFLPVRPLARVPGCGNIVMEDF